MKQWQFFDTYEDLADVSFADRFLYDSRNRLIATIDKNGLRADSVFDAAGQPIAAVDRRGNASFTRLDQRGRVIERRGPDPDGLLMAGSPSAPVASQKYDPAGNLIESTDALGNTTKYTYDSMNRLRKETRKQTLIADDAEFSDSSFSYSYPSPPPATPTYFGDQDAGLYDRDYSQLDTPLGSPRDATWNFGKVPAALYRISIAAVSLAPEAAAGATVEVLFNGNVQPALTKTIEQLRTAPKFVDTHGITQIEWAVLAENVSLPANQSISIKLSINVNGLLIADAVRLDRDVSREYDYDDNGNLTSEKDTLGGVTTHAYDELNREISVTSPDPDGPAAGTLPALVTYFFYDGYGNLRRTIEDRGGEGHERSNLFTYDDRNRLTTKTIDEGDESHKNLLTSYEYDAAGNVTLQTDPLGFKTYSRYDGLNRLIDRYDNYQEGSAAPLSFTAVDSYPPFDGLFDVPSDADLLNNGTTVALSGNAWKAVGLTYTVEHDTVLDFEFTGDRKALTVGIGFTTDTPGYAVKLFRLFESDFEAGSGIDAAWNGEFQQHFVPGETIRFHIPIGQYLTEDEKRTGLAITKIVLINVEMDSLRSAAYRGNSNFSDLRIYDSDEVRTAFTYDTRGNVETVRAASDPRNIQTLHQYDRLGRRTDTYQDDGGQEERHLQTTYDAAGNVISERNASAAAETVYEYDRLGRRITTTLPDADGNPATANGLVSQFTYDAAGRLVVRENGEHEKEYTLYNELDLPVSTVDGNGDETRYRYDSEGNLVEFVDAAQNVTSYTYDNFNRLRTEKITAIWDSELTTLTSTNVYNAQGNLLSILDRNGHFREFTYDRLDRRKTETWRSGGVTYNTLTWLYDDLGRVTRQADDRNTPSDANDDLVDTFEYDGLGRLTEQTNYDPDNSTVSTSRPEIRQTYVYAYELVGSEFSDSRRRTESIRTAAGAFTPIGTTLQQTDRLGRTALQSDGDADLASGPAVASKQLVFGYDAAGNLADITHSANPNGSGWDDTFMTHWTHDKAGRVTSIRHDLEPGGSATDIVHSYGYDNASRITSFDTGGTTRDFVYDNAGQLRSKTGGAGETYEYDGNGNRKLVGSQAITTSQANRVTNDGTFTYEYSKQGSLKSRVRISESAATDKTTEYSWDHRKRLSKVTTRNNLGQATSTVEYTYDASDRRVKRVYDQINPSDGQPPKSEYFVYDGADVSLRFDHDKKLTHRYQYGPQTDQVLVDEVFSAAGQSTDTLWMLADHQGTIRDVVDDTLTLRKHVDYDSFGKMSGELFYSKSGESIDSTHAEAVDQLFSYTGQEWDSHTKLVNYNARWYDPHTGRFLSEDPSGLDGGDANFYRYVGNSPLNGTDPTGMSIVKPVAKLATSVFQALVPGPFGTLANLAAPAAFAGAAFASTQVGGQHLDPNGKESASYLSRVGKGAAEHSEGLLEGMNPLKIPGNLWTHIQQLPEDWEMAKFAWNQPGAYIQSRATAARDFVEDRLLTPEGQGKTLVDGLLVLLARKLGKPSAGRVEPLPRKHLTAAERQQLADSIRIDDQLTINQSAALKQRAPVQTGDPFIDLYRAPSTSLSPAVQQGNLFNRLRQPKYEFGEVYVDGPGGRRYILDAYSPTSGEIVSLKATQFGHVGVKTGVQYVQEAATKYAPGARIANVPTSGGLAGQELRGTLYLEVPIQVKPIPQKVLDAATKNRVIIRDVTGKEY
ncbi:MAG: RHS repeat-associated core domain-containing protein [Pirellulales bacterium]